MKYQFVLKATLRALAVASLQTTSAQTITANLAAPPGSVNTNIPGMKMRLMQGNARSPLTTVATAEILLSGKQIDPQTGVPFVNEATPNPADGSYTYDIDRYVNYHEQIPNNPDITGGNFFTGPTPPAAPHNIPDEAEPGIPGVNGSGDYFVMEFTGYLQLPSGTVRFGVNSDDGFRMTIGSGVNPRIPSLQLIQNDGNRGFGNTEANITVSAAGIYPFRVIYWENAGANSGIELYTFQPGQTSGNRYLINDTNQANSIRSYRELVGNPPTILIATPALTTYVDVNGIPTAVPPAPYMYVQVIDGATTVNTNSISFALDGTLLATNITKAANLTTVVAQAPILGAGTVHTNSLIYANSAGTSYTNIWTFTVGNYPAITAQYALASVDTTKPGFKAKIHQMDVNRNPSLGLVPNAERQIADGYINPATGQPYANTASTSWTHADGVTVDPIGADGFYVSPGVVNWHDQGAAGGGTGESFPTANDTVPGIPGTGLFPANGYVLSIETILELKAGAYRFGVNSDDS